MKKRILTAEFIFLGLILSANITKTMQQPPSAIPDQKKSSVSPHALGLSHESKQESANFSREIDEIQKQPLFQQRIRDVFDAAEKGSFITFRQFSQMGISPNVLDSEGMTPLHVAAAHGYLDLVKLMLKLGAFSDVQNKNGETPSQLAEKNGHKYIAKLLQKKDTTKRETAIDTKKINSPTLLPEQRSENTKTTTITCRACLSSTSAPALHPSKQPQKRKPTTTTTTTKTSPKPSPLPTTSQPKTPPTTTTTTTLSPSIPASTTPPVPSQNLIFEEECLCCQEKPQKLVVCPQCKKVMCSPCFRKLIYAQSFTVELLSVALARKIQGNLTPELKEVEDHIKTGCHGEALYLKADARRMVQKLKDEIKVKADRYLKGKAAYVRISPDEHQHNLYHITYEGWKNKEKHVRCPNCRGAFCFNAYIEHEK